MSFSNHGRFRQQVRFLQRQFLQDGELPFTDVLSEETVHASTESGECRLARPSLFAAGDAVGFPWPGAEPGSFLSCGRGPLDCSSRLTRTKRPARRKRAPIAKPGSVCRRSSSLASLVSLEKRSTTKSIPAGCGKVDLFTCSMERRCRCPTRQRIKPHILRSTTRNRGWVSRLPESVRLCLCRVERCST